MNLMSRVSSTRSASLHNVTTSSERGDLFDTLCRHDKFSDADARVRRFHLTLAALTAFSRPSVTRHSAASRLEGFCPDCRLLSAVYDEAIICCK